MPVFNPLDHPVCLARPWRAVPSAWTEHVPFAMFLVDALRPQVLVELGTHHGMSYCAFCQAVQQLQLPTRCYAVDTWTGDNQAGFYGPEVFADLRKHHDSRYGSFSRLLQGTFDNALAHFPDGSIDLLHIDGHHSYESVRHDFEGWLPKVSQGGVVLFHDINVREGDFGAWNLWDELKSRYPFFAFFHEHGLGLLAVGPSYPPLVRQLVEASDMEAVRIREFFHQLGQRLSSQWRYQQELEALAAQAGDKDRHLDMLSGKTAEQEDKLRLLTAQMLEKEQAIDLLSKQSAESRQTVETLSVRLAQKQEALEARTKQLRETEQTLKAVSDQLAEKERLVASLEAGPIGRAGRLLRAVSDKPCRRVKRAWEDGHRMLRKVRRVWRNDGLQAVIAKTWAKALAGARRLLRRSSPWGVRIGIDGELPESLSVGRGTVLYFTGWCYHPESRVAAVSVLWDGRPHPVGMRGLRREDVFEQHGPDLDPKGYSLHSGFTAMVPIAADQQAASVSLGLQVHLRNGRNYEATLGTIRLEAGGDPVDHPLAPDAATDEPVIAICMTTYNSDADLLQRQIQSIQAQTHTNWICVICDDCSAPEAYDHVLRLVEGDARFRLHRNGERLGFYANFEKCLGLAPPEAAFVALADHDDYWHPDKLATLLSHFDKETTLVYSDMNIVDREGKLLSNTYWTTRLNNFTDFGWLVLANTVTGAASLFRRQLLDYVLPFPSQVGDMFHDHWIASVALALGRIKYIDRPLYDYVQHRANVVGHYAAGAIPLWAGLLRYFRWLWPAHLKAKAHAFLTSARDSYFHHILRLQLNTRTLRLRCQRQLTPGKRRALRPIDLAAAGSWRGWPWLMLRILRGIGRPNVGLDIEHILLKHILWTKYLWWRRRLPSIWRGRVPGGQPAPASPYVEVARHDRVRKFQSNAVEFIRQKMAPLPLNIAPTAPRRVNLLISTIDFKYLFAGYLATFHLARCLAERGYKSRLVIVDECDYEPKRWAGQFRSYAGLEKLLDGVETAYAFGRQTPLEVSKQDAFVAHSWWTAHVAHQAVRALGRERFVYLTQDYEPAFYPMGSLATLAAESYALPHYAVFSTELLRDYSRQQRIGVFGQSLESGERDSVAFENAITSVGQVALDHIASRTPKKLLLYARPEAHATRNLFEIAVLALGQAVRAGYFAGEWEFHGVGSINTLAKVRLAKGAYLYLLPRQNLAQYRQLLRQHDLGLSLMYTPHPSLVPIEMAAAGMLTVTNSYATKTADRLRAISPNFITVEPTVSGVAEGLREAAANIANYEARVLGAQVQWSTSWEQSFNPSVMDRIAEFIEASCREEPGRPLERSRAA